MKIHINWMQETGRRLMRIFPETLIGTTKEYEKELYVLYGKKENNSTVISMKTENLKKYVIIAGGILFLLVITLVGSTIGVESPFATNEKGEKYIERPAYSEGNIQEKLIISGKVDGKPVKKQVILSIKPEGANSKEEIAESSEPTAEEIASKNLSSELYSINKSDEGKVVYLPSKIEGMESISWGTKEDSSIGIILILAAFLFIYVYFARYDKLKNLKRQCGISIEEDLPEFLNKLVLLMNAGLVLNSAFEKVVGDYNSSRYKKKSYFYEQLGEISKKAAETNASAVEELKRFAERSRNREFMRITNVISDNIHKGTELVNILQNESGFLWFQRKKRAEEKGKIAETKLTAPLAMQLVVLIMITLAPAMLDM